MQLGRARRRHRPPPPAACLRPWSSSSAYSPTTGRGTQTLDPRRRAKEEARAQLGGRHHSLTRGAGIGFGGGPGGPIGGRGEGILVMSVRVVFARRCGKRCGRGGHRVPLACVWPTGRPASAACRPRGTAAPRGLAGGLARSADEPLVVHIHIRLFRCSIHSSYSPALLSGRRHSPRPAPPSHFSSRRAGVLCRKPVKEKKQN